MREVGRNDLCPCMSGKKYKKCCENNNITKDLQKDNLVYYNERYMISNVIEDIRFKEFYSQNRDKLPNDLIFVTNEKLRASMSYGIFPSNSSDFKWMIVNKNSPIEQNKALDLVHEMQHIINCMKHYPIVAYKEKYSSNNNIPCKNISDMLNDPIVNKVVASYRFDLYSYFNIADNIQIPMIDRLNGHIKNTFLITSYVKRYLDYRNINPNINKDDIRFIRWCQQNYSNLVEDAELILHWIEQVGYETTEGAEIIFANTIKLLKYEEYMEIKKF